MRWGMVLLLMVAGSAGAQEVDLSELTNFRDGEFSFAVAYSKHYSDTYRHYDEDATVHHEFETTHYLVGYHHPIGVDGYVFNNSYGDPAAAIGKRFTYQVSPWLEADAFIGVAFGYKNDNAQGHAWAGLNTDIGGGFKLEIKGSYGVVLLGIAKRFD